PLRIGTQAIGSFCWGIDKAQVYDPYSIDQSDFFSFYYFLARINQFHITNVDPIRKQIFYTDGRIGFKPNCFTRRIDVFVKMEVYFFLWILEVVFYYFFKKILNILCLDRMETKK